MAIIGATKSYVKKETILYTYYERVSSIYPKFYAAYSVAGSSCTVTADIYSSMDGVTFSPVETKTATGSATLGSDGLYTIANPIPVSSNNVEAVRLYVSVTLPNGEIVSVDENGDAATVDAILKPEASARLEDWRWDNTAEYCVHMQQIGGTGAGVHEKGKVTSIIRYVSVSHIYEMDGSTEARDILSKPVGMQRTVYTYGKYFPTGYDHDYGEQYGIGVKLTADMLAEPPVDGKNYKIVCTLSSALVEGSVDSNQNYNKYIKDHVPFGTNPFSVVGKDVAVSAPSDAAFGVFGHKQLNGESAIKANFDVEQTVYAHYVSGSASYMTTQSVTVPSDGMAQISYGRDYGDSISFMGEPAVSYSTALSQNIYSVAGQTLPKAFYGKSAKRSMTFTAKGTNVETPAEIDREKLEALAIAGDAVLRMPGGVTHKVAVQSVAYGYGYGNKVTGITIPMVEVQ